MLLAKWCAGVALLVALGHALLVGLQVFTQGPLLVPHDVALRGTVGVTAAAFFVASVWAWYLLLSAAYGRIWKPLALIGAAAAPLLAVAGYCLASAYHHGAERWVRPTNPTEVFGYYGAASLQFLPLLTTGVLAGLVAIALLLYRRVYPEMEVATRARGAAVLRALPKNS